jgi:hypothetical protein
MVRMARFAAGVSHPLQLHTSLLKSQESSQVGVPTEAEGRTEIVIEVEDEAEAEGKVATRVDQSPLLKNVPSFLFYFRKAAYSE